MYLATANAATAVSNHVLVTATPGKIIRATRILLTCWQPLSITPLSDPEGSATALVPTIYSRAYTALDLRLGRRYAINTPRGKDFGCAIAFQSMASNWSLAVWYDLVD